MPELAFVFHDAEVRTKLRAAELPLQWEMLIASDILSDEGAWRRTLDAHRPAHVILDNGAYELRGESVDDETLLKVARIVNPATLVLPDVFGGSAMQSADRTVAALRNLSAKLEARVSWIAPLHGDSVSDLLRAAERIASAAWEVGGADIVWGLPKVTQKRTGVCRSLVAEALGTRFSYAVHFLGRADDFSDLRRPALRYLQSFDTSAIWDAARRKRFLYPPPRPGAPAQEEKAESSDPVAVAVAAAKRWREYLEFLKLVGL